VSRLAQARQLTQRVLIEANVSGEDTKDGIAPHELPALLEVATTLENIRVEGLMTMAPIATALGDETPRRTFEALRQLRDNLVPVFAGAENICLNELSMGMSDDFEAAIAEGATIVRIGRRLWS
jgi:uncharacterized pyridoxal phosphate-containing UPF0001 family protein